MDASSVFQEVGGIMIDSWTLMRTLTHFIQDELGVPVVWEDDDICPLDSRVLKSPRYPAELGGHWFNHFITHFRVTATIHARPQEKETRRSAQVSFEYWHGRRDDYKNVNSVSCTVYYDPTTMQWLSKEEKQSR